MCTTTDPATAAEALDMLGSAAGMQERALRFLAAEDAAALPGPAVADQLRMMERNDAIEAAVRGRLLEVFDSQDGHLADGQRTTRTWLVHSLRVTKGQAAEYRAVQALARSHRVLHAALAEGWVLTTSEALQLARWTRAIPQESRDKAEEILVAAARGGVACAAWRRSARRSGPAPPSATPIHDNDQQLDRGVSLDTTFDGAGVDPWRLDPRVHGDGPSRAWTPSPPPQGGGDLRTRPQRYHDALSEAMKRLLASDLLPQRAGQPVKALVHIYFAELREMDRTGSSRTSGSRSTGPGGPPTAPPTRSPPATAAPGWKATPPARSPVDAMIIPVVTGDIDPAAVEDLIALCVQFHQLRTQSAPADPADPGPAGGPADPAADTGTPDGAALPAGLTSTAARHAGQAAAVADALAELEHQILGKILQVVSGPGGAASFLRRHLLGKPLAGPSLPLDVGQTDDIPLHLRRLVALRDQTCQFAGGCDQPASGCEPHHVTHRADGGRTSLTNLKDYCYWHHHVVLHELGWTLTVHPDGSSQVTSPDGKTIRSHGPPPRPG